MVKAKNNNIDEAKVLRKTKIETTYEYVPIIGEVLGFWRKVIQSRTGETIEVHLNHSLNVYDRLLINGVEIEISEVISENPLTK